MRIISKFRDYYDCIQQYGQDDIIYNRHIIEITDICLNHLETWMFGYRGPLEYTWRNVKIGFCGRLYTGFQFRHKGKPITKYLFAWEQVEKLYKEKGWEIEDKVWKQNGLKRDFESVDRLNQKSIGWFEKYKSPIFVCEKTKDIEELDGWGKLKNTRRCNFTEINGRLSPFDFQSVFSPPLAFNEIRNFLSNLARPEKQIPHIPDEIMLEAKGFDKYSFRKDKSKK